MCIEILASGHTQIYCLAQFEEKKKSPPKNHSMQFLKTPVGGSKTHCSFGKNYSFYLFSEDILNLNKSKSTLLKVTQLSWLCP